MRTDAAPPVETPLWRPHAPAPGRSISGQEAALMIRNVPRVLIEAGRGGGKTAVALARFSLCVGMGFGPRWVGILFRRRANELRNDLLPKAREFFSAAYGRGVRFYESASDYFFEWPTGERLMLRHCYDERGYDPFHGGEFLFQFWDELAAWPDPLTLLEAFRGTQRAPIKALQPYVIQLCATNPYGPGAAAIKRHFVRDPSLPMEIIEPDPAIRGDTRRARIHCPLEENRALLDAQPNYVADTIEPIANEGKRRAWVGGLDRWDQSVGGYFSEVWQESVHVLHGTPRFDGTGWRFRRSFDWGFTAPLALLFGAIATRDQVLTVEQEGRVSRAVFVRRGSIVVWREWYPLQVNKQGIEQYNKGVSLSPLAQGAEIARRSRGFVFSGCVADPSIFATGGRETSLYDGLVRGATQERYSLELAPADNARVAGWLGIVDLLKAALTEDERANTRRGNEPISHAEAPSLYITSACAHLIRTISAAPRDEKQIDDIDSKSEDHLLDALRYLTNSTGANQATPGTLRTH